MSSSDPDKDRAEQVERTYLQGKPLFSRGNLLEISRQLSRYRAGDLEAPPTIELFDYVEGQKKPYTITLDFNNDSTYIKLLQYNSIQLMINPAWYRRTRKRSDPDADLTLLVNPIQVVRILKTNYSTRGRIGNVSSKDLRSAYKEFHLKWAASETRKSIQGAFLNISIERRKRVKKIVGFGCGSIVYLMPRDKYAEKDIPFESWDESDDIRWSHTFQRVVAQHAFINEIRTIIESTCTHKVACYAQDPQYRPLDKELLSDLKITLLDDPDGLLEVDDSTLVLSMGAELPLLQILTDLKSKPAMLLHQVIETEKWEDYKTLKTKKDAYGEEYQLPVKGTLIDSTSPRVEKMMQEHQEIAIDDPDNWFAGEWTRLYIRN